MSDGYILITGASSGIGRQCAIRLSEKYNLVLCARRKEKLEETRSLCKHSAKHLIFCCDLGDVSSLPGKLTEFITNNDIKVTKFLHSAGTLQLLGAKGFDLSVTENIFRVNLFSAMAVIKVLLKKENKKALDNIIFISSLYSKKGAVGNSFYASSKGALDSYMRSIALELAPRVRVNSILPGGIETAMTDDMTEEQKKEMEKGYPLGFGETADIASMAEFLFSDAAKWITGQQISVDGGAGI